MKLSEFKYKGFLVGIGDKSVADADIRASVDFEWQANPTDEYVFVLADVDDYATIIEVFDITGKLADDDIRTAYIDQELELLRDRCGDEPVEVEYNLSGFICGNIADEKWASKVYDRAFRAAKGVQAVDWLVKGKNCEYSLDVDIDETSSGGALTWLISDNIHGYSEECLEKNVMVTLSNYVDDEDLYPYAIEIAKAKFEEVRPDDYFAPYRLEWLADDLRYYDEDEDEYGDSEDNEVLEELQQAIDDGTLREIQSFYEAYMGGVALYSARSMLERGVFVLLDEPYIDALNGYLGYIVYAIDKFVETTDQDYLDEHQDSVEVQFDAIKKYFNEYEWLQEMSNKDFLPALKRLSAEIRAKDDFDELSPLEELKYDLKKWVNGNS